jgi:hypothetical protein
VEVLQKRATTLETENSRQLNLLRQLRRSLPSTQMTTSSSAVNHSPVARRPMTAQATSRTTPLPGIFQKNNMFYFSRL